MLLIWIPVDNDDKQAVYKNGNYKNFVAFEQDSLGCGWDCV